MAHSCADASGPSSPNQDKPHKSLAEAAMAYQEEHLSPPKSQPARVAVVTGEEEERNVLQVSIGYLWYTVALEIGTLWPSGQQYVALKISTLGCKPSSFSPNASGFRIKHWDSKNFPSIDRQKYYAPLQFN